MMDAREGRHGNDVWDVLGDVARTFWRALARLVREGNRRQLAFRNRRGETVFRLPLTVAVLIAIFLIWEALPLLILLLVVAFALRGSLVVLRREAA